MTNSYSGNPDDSAKDAVRFLLQDVKEPWLFTDEEIQYTIEMAGGAIYTAASDMADRQASKYADRRDKTVGPLSIKYGDIMERWAKVASGLRSRGTRSSGAIAITTQRSRVPHFQLGIHDNGLARVLDRTLSGESNRLDEALTVDGGSID